jgi:hypothetical protein
MKNKTNTDSVEDVCQQALEALEKLGRRDFTPEAQAQMSQAQCVARGIIMATGGQFDVLDCAAEMLEDRNDHVTSAIMRALSKGACRKQADNKYLVTTELPPNWGS